MELELMGRLASAEADAVDAGDLDRAEGLSDEQRRFLTDHILEWVPAFCDGVERAALVPFYRELTRLTRRFLMTDRDFAVPVAEESPSK